MKAMPPVSSMPPISSRPPEFPGTEKPRTHSPPSLIAAALIVIVLAAAGIYYWGMYAKSPSSSGTTSACPTPPADITLGASLSGALSQVAAGAAMTVTGSVENQSQENVSDATLYVKILRQAQGKSYPVDFFPLDGTVAIPAGGTAPVSVSWQIPADAINGNYVFALALMTKDGSLEAGTPTPDGPYFAAYPFSVTAGVDAGTAFDPASLLLNGVSVPSGLPLYVDGTSPTRLDLSVTNGASLGVKTALTWTLYAGAFPTGAPLSATTTILKVQPGSSARATFISSDFPKATYYLVGSFATKNGARSLVGLRLLNGAFAEQCAATSTPATP